jgi:copper chaperone CopZ
MKAHVALSGSIVAAIAASLCCIGPLVVLALGLGTFGAAAALESVRPYLLGLTALLLAGAFYLTYRKREVKCEGSCQSTGAGRPSKIVLWIATVAIIGFATFPYYSTALIRASTQKGDPAAQGSRYSSANSREETAVIGVEGMSCGSCAVTVRLALSKLRGVSSAEVSLENKEAKVTYDPGLATPEQLEAAIDGSGFKATDIKTMSGKSSDRQRKTEGS